MAVTWLHVSDFHLSNGAPYDQEVILRALVESVKRFREEGHIPDLIFATGDIAQNGKAKEYDSATKFFDTLLDAAGLNRDRLFVIPGNHDVDRREGEFLARSISSEASADRYFSPDKSFPHLTHKFQPFSEWYNDYFNTIRSYPTNTTCSPVEILTINGSRLAVLPLNSALFCIGDDDHQKLFIGRRCLDEAKKHLAAADLTIALMHHPLDWLSPLEQANIEDTLEASVDLLLQGHFHQIAAKGIVSANGGYLKLAAGAAYQTREWPNSAMYVTFDCNQVTIFPIRYEDSPKERWTLDTSIFSSPSYTKSFPIPGRADAGLPPLAVYGNTTSRTQKPQPTSNISASLVRIIKILVASPGDVAEERKMAVEVILDWNARHPNSRIRLEAVLWEHYAAPENRGDGKGPQEPINRQLADECDFAIGIFWTRIGTPTKIAPGGAVEEVQRILANQKPVMLYFSNVAYRRNEIELDQIAKLDEFRTAMQGDGLVWEYEERHEFENQLARHLDFHVFQWFPDGFAESREEPRRDLKELFYYQETLKADLGSITMLGLPGVESTRVNLDDNTFVPLRLSDKPKEGDFCDGQNMRQGDERGERIFYPDELMKRAFRDGRGLRLLLVIGDPGAGKTTLLKYYALCALDPERSNRLGFSCRVNVFYLPLRELVRHEKENDKACYDSLPANLSLWYKRHHHTLSEDVFNDWLQDGTSLVLLDGLDEISNTEKRKEVCRWIDNAWSGFNKAFFVVTSRATGYRKDEEIELEPDYERADVQDFKPEQQESFIKKWFNAAFLKEARDEGVDKKEWLQVQNEKANERATRMVAHLNEEKNRGLRQLAAIPMILQIMAILWKEKDYMPESRVKLYDAALNYMLEIKDRRRGIAPDFTKTSSGVMPSISAERARWVLAPVSLWMQVELHSDKADRVAMQTNMQIWLNTFDNAPSVEEFCDYLVKRAGVLVAYGRDYLFRHKTFREYLASVELVKNVLRSPKDLDTVIAAFGEDWWDEPIKFFIAQGDAEIFDLFMEKFFTSPISDPLTLERQLLLRTIIEEAPQKKVDALCKKLLEPKTTSNRQRLILDCLKAINKASALAALQEFSEKKLAKESKDITSRTAEVIRFLGGQVDDHEAEKPVYGTTLSIVNPNEDNAEYILIKKGSYLDSETKEKKDVEKDLYFAKYPVTNKRYRSFIEAIEEASEFIEELQDTAQNNKWDVGFRKYLEDGQNDLAALFRSTYDDDRKFGGDDQPVVGITWYAAQAYALWLSQLEGKPDSYRLPNEVEWQWAAGGRQGETVQEVREYPWVDDKGEPNSKLLNYGFNVGATTPVGSYPDGATPEGLYDMAGNVCEWTDSWYNEATRSHRVVRGGGWGSGAGLCRSAVRLRFTPDYRNFVVGFRLVFVP